jgi:SNF2 family DNA or RNA helicase
MPETPRFSIGDHVRRRSAPAQSGVVKQKDWSDQDSGWLYKVNFGMPPARMVPDGDLELVPEDVDPWIDLLTGRTDGAQAFQKLLTFERVHRPPSRVAESFGTARAKLLPYQFKPLLKFLDSSRQRLLIADDVGLGKTIEAGYIFKELKARHSIEQCLIVVPARLRTKWKRELEERFDERFDVVNAKDIRTRLLERMQDGHEPDPFLWIASYETLRRPEIVSGFNDLQPSIDLVVLDEAHRVSSQRRARSSESCRPKR